MAGKKITQMTENTSLSTGDLIEHVDVSETISTLKNKKVTVETLSTYINGLIEDEVELATIQAYRTMI